MWREKTMSETRVKGGFLGDPAAALAVSGTGGCCGNPPQALTLPDPAVTAATVGAEAAPCCGTTTEAQASGGCCGTQAKAEAVAAGAGCCG
jgi:hypothetical protein